MPVNKSHWQMYIMNFFAVLTSSYAILRDKVGQIGPKIKAVLTLYEYSHTRQFEDNKCKYDNKRILKFKSQCETMFPVSNIQLLGDRHQISSKTDLYLLRIWRLI